MKTKKLMALLMATSMMLAAAGCGQTAENEKEEKPASSPAQSQEKEETPSAESEVPAEPDKITMLVADKYVADYETNQLSLLVEEYANVDIEFISVPRDELATKLSLMVNGGSDLPDMISTVGLPSTFDYGTAGVYLPLNDYLNDPEKMPNFNKIREEDRSIMIGGVVQPDGNVYAATWFHPGAPGPYYTRAFINQDWLDAVDMDMPTTTEEFYQVLKAFKEQDPNGNGVADEIPAISADKGGFAIAYLMNPFIYVQKDAVEYVNIDENGKAYPAFVTDEWKQGLEYMHKLVSEELLTSVSFTQDNSEFNAIVQSQPVGVYFSGLYDNVQDVMYNYEPLPTLTGPNGDNFITICSYTPTETMAIFADTENLDACIRVMDAFYDRDISAHEWRGELGVDWTTEVPDGYVLSQPVEGVDKPGWITLVPQWGVPSNTKIWMNYCPGYLAANDPLSQGCEGVLMDENATDISAVSSRQIAKLISVQMESGTYLKNQLKRVLLEESDQIEFADLKTQISTYVAESIVRFATGDMDLSEWDNYIKTLEDMGLDRFIELIQNGYDFYNNAAN